MERGFIAFLYEHGLSLPDRAQHRPSDDLYVQTDFYYEDSCCCIFVDGAVHDQASVRASDRTMREALRDRGYRVIIVGPDFERAVRARPDIFGQMESGNGTSDSVARAGS